MQSALYFLDEFLPCGSRSGSYRLVFETNPVCSEYGEYDFVEPTKEGKASQKILEKNDQIIKILFQVNFIRCNLSNRFSYYCICM